MSAAKGNVNSMVPAAADRSGVVCLVLYPSRAAADKLPLCRGVLCSGRGGLERWREASGAHFNIGFLLIRPSAHRFAKARWAEGRRLGT